MPNNVVHRPQIFDSKSTSLRLPDPSPKSTNLQGTVPYHSTVYSTPPSCRDSGHGHAARRHVSMLERREEQFSIQGLDQPRPGPISHPAHLHSASTRSNTTLSNTKHHYIPPTNPNAMICKEICPGEWRTWNGDERRFRAESIPHFSGE